MSDTYRTIHKISKGQYKEKGSKFLSFAMPVSDLHEVNAVLEEYKKSYHHASHHCYGYRLGIEGETYRANDDGEPTHSAGDPILGQIRAFGLTQILVVVIRYFGGTKLGVGGLVNAYRTAAKLALENAEIVEATQCQKLAFTYEYEQTNLIMALINKYGLNVLEQSFTDYCSMTLDCPVSKLTQVNEDLEALGICSS